MATKVDRKKMQFAAFDCAFSTNFYKRKNFEKIFHPSRVTDHFVPNFVALATGVDQKKIQLAAFDGPFSKTPL